MVPCPWVQCQSLPNPASMGDNDNLGTSLPVSVYRNVNDKAFKMVLLLGFA